MKNVTIIFLATLLVAAPVVFAHDHHVTYSSSHNHSNFFDGVDIDIRHHSIILTSDEYDNDDDTQHYHDDHSADTANSSG